MPLLRSSSGSQPGAAFVGAIAPLHPFDLLYNHVVRKFTGTPPLPPNGVLRRFACGLAAVWLIGTGAAFYVGQISIGYILGTVQTVTAKLSLFRISAWDL